MDNKTESSFKTKCCWWWRCERAQTWLRPLTSVVCHEMLFWCQSQLRWPLLPPHNTSSTPQPSVLLIHWASTCIPTIHFPWRLSFSLSLPLTLLLLFFSLSPSHRKVQKRTAHSSPAKISESQYSITAQGKEPDEETKLTLIKNTYILL